MALRSHFLQQTIHDGVPLPPFQLMAERLSGCTEKCTVSFLDFYRKTERNMRSLKVQKETGKLQLELLERFAETAKAQGLYIDTCARRGILADWA